LHPNVESRLQGYLEATLHGCNAAKETRLWHAAAPLFPDEGAPPHEACLFIFISSTGQRKM
jgi:hypothetical protein